MTEFAADWAAADLTSLEEGALRGLASLGKASVGDVAEFVAGFVETDVVDAQETRGALCCLDALGWAQPDGNPWEAESWWITAQGRLALQWKPS